VKRTPLLLALSALLVLGLLGPVAAEGDGDAPYYPTPWVEVGRDTGVNTFGGDAETGALGNALGADLKNGSIRMLDADTIEFRIDTHNLPATGGTPEAVRYTWDFQVPDTAGVPQAAQIDGKWSNYSRGSCDPTSGQCNPPGKLPRNPGMQPFLFRANQQASCLGTTATGSCTGLNFTAYDELGQVIQADFDAAAATITVAVPVALFNDIKGVEGFGHCSSISPRAGLFGGMIEAMPAAFISSTAFPHDAVTPKSSRDGGGVYQLPHAEDAETDCDGNLIGDVEE
jgi:hypothetical protein